jgi:hypothetical protein
LREVRGGLEDLIGRVGCVYIAGVLGAFEGLRGEQASGMEFDDEYTYFTTSTVTVAMTVTWRSASVCHHILSHVERREHLTQQHY